MALTPKLDLRQVQTLVMTPQLQQAIRLLQLSNIELGAYVENELEQNPLLEHSDDSPADDGPGDDLGVTAEEGALPGLDADYDNLWSSNGVGEGAGAAPQESWRHSGGGGGELVDQTPAETPGLRQHLLNQINLELDDPVDRMIGVHLIEMLDDAGYLGDDLTPIAQRLSCGVARVEATLAKVQNFDPPGVFARDLAECLALQLRERDRLDPLIQVVLDNLDLMAEQKTEELQARCGVDDEEFAEMLAEIRALNPKPGLAYDSELTQTVIPDVFLRSGPDGDWVIELNNDTLPRVLVNQRYYATVSRQAKTKAEKDYLADRLTSANWLVKSLDQRASTILRVSTELTRQQSAFFVHGVEHLRPLIMRDIASAIDMHESTVSRVIANKFMATPRGIYELRYFFTNAIASTAGHGEGHSSEAVRYQIKQLIEGEAPDKPLSDDHIVNILKSRGVDIARRTVAKYREAMHLPSSLERRRNSRRKR